VAVTFGSVAPGAAGITTTTGALSWTHAIASDDTMLAAYVACGTDGRTLTAAVTPGPLTMTTNAGSNLWKRHTADGTSGFVQWYVLPGPPSAQTVTITFSGASSGDRLTAGSMTFKGTPTTSAGYGTPVSAADTTSSNTTPATVNVVTASASNMVAAFMASGTTYNSPATAPSTQRINCPGDYGSGAGNSAAQTAPASGGTVTMACPLSAADYWAILAVELLGGTPAGTATAVVASGTGAAQSAVTIPASLITGPNYATAASALSGGYGTWLTPDYAEGGP
jgi:hypothetical protein